MRFRKRKNQLSCEEADVLIFLQTNDVSALSREEHEALEGHLSACAACRQKKIEEDAFVAVIKGHWGLVSDRTLEPAQEVRDTARTQRAHSTRRRLMTVSEGWEDLKTRIPELATLSGQRDRTLRLRKLFWQVAATAAVLVIALCLGLQGLQALIGSQSTTPHEIISQHSERHMHGTSVELIDSSGRQTLAIGQNVAAEELPLEILLGGMHRVVLNRNTTASFHANDSEPLGNTVFYEVRLTKGELYAEVIPGHEFNVRTTNALITVTGTKFDVRASTDRTDLVLVKGGVTFSKADAPSICVEVAAGHMSSIVGKSHPTTPYVVDAAAMVAWARDVAIANALANAGSDTEDLLGSVRDFCFQTSIPAANSIDYDTWLEEHREWFKREFPWIFTSKEFLSREHGLDVDPIELLMVSGDIWQFHYPRSWQRPIPVFDLAAVQRIAESYGVEAGPLLQILKPVYSHTDEPTGAKAYADAMDNWQSDVNRAVRSKNGMPSDLLIFTMRAGAFLCNTRVAAQLWIRDYPERAEQLLTDEKYLSGCLSPLIAKAVLNTGSLVEVLPDHLTAAQGVISVAQELLITPTAPGCHSHVAILSRELTSHICSLTQENSVFDE